MGPSRESRRERMQMNRLTHLFSAFIPYLFAAAIGILLALPCIGP
jgi:hypothetical protein